MFSHYFKVGVGILAAVAILFAGYTKVQENRMKKGEGYQLRVVFDNVEGIDVGNAVWLSGIKIGSVKKMTLRPDGRVLLNLEIDKKYKIHKGSNFTIRVGVLEDKVLSIEKPEELKPPYEYYKPNALITNSHSPATLQSLVEQADKAMSEVNAILANTHEIVESDQLKNDILTATANIARTTQEAAEFAKMLKETGAANRGHIDATLQNIDRLSKNFIATSEKLDQLIAHANDVVGDEKFKQDVKDIADELKLTMENLKETTKSFRDMATDEEIKKDVKETIKSTRATMENADVALSGFSKMVHAINDTQVKPDFEFRYEGKDDQYYADMNLRIFPPSSDVYYLLGFDDLGEASTTNLQLGVHGGRPDTWYRFGIKSGKLGIGMEGQNRKQTIYYEGELVDPNDLQLNMRIGRTLSKNTYFLTGWEKAFKKDSLSVGVVQRY